MRARPKAMEEITGARKRVKCVIFAKAHATDNIENSQFVVELGASAL